MNTDDYNLGEEKDNDSDNKKEIQAKDEDSDKEDGEVEENNRLNLITIF
jgi:hypothetical protein